jgi:4-amino-4-deoxy-L-arabinose transferase-like glycosyltransferase
LSSPATTEPLSAAPQRPPRRLHSSRWRPRPEHAALGGILVISCLLEFVRLSQNGYANVFYSSAVKSMLRSLHLFFFASSDPNGFITVDKPPLGLWVQVLSAKLFGFSPASLLIPEGIFAVLAVALLYFIVAPRFGTIAGLAAALALAVFPSFVAVGRDNGVDPLLILLMLAACGAALNAIDTGRLRWLLASAVLVGLAFNTKSLAAVLCVPGIAVGYLACAPGALKRRLAQLVAAGVVLVVVSGAWIAAVDLTPASQRPFVGSSTNNTEVQLLLQYNGFGRVGGQQGGPGSTIDVLDPDQIAPLWRPGYNTPPTPLERTLTKPTPVRIAEPKPPAGRQRLAHPIPFGGTRSPLRIFASGLGDQAGWDVALALVGLIAVAFVVRRRGDRRWPALIVLGGWMLVELATLDFSSGIVHPYYASALAPGLAAMVGAGAVAIASLASSRSPNRALLGYALAVVAIVANVGVQLLLIRREGDPLWWQIPLVLLSTAALAAIPFVRRRAGLAIAAAVALALVAPMVYSFSVWLAPVEGTFPVAGPYNYAGPGGIGVGRVTEHAYRGLIAFLAAHGETERYPLLTESSDQAGPLMLLGLRASPIGGYGASDPSLSGAGLAGLVASGQARYLLIGGPYAGRGGNGATTAARLVCPEIPQAYWGAGTGQGTTPQAGSYLVDCRGFAAELRHPYGTARAFLRAHPTIRYSLQLHPHG